MPKFDAREEIRLLSEGVSRSFQCYLDEDWRFGEIEADARQRLGHNYSGRRHQSIAEIILKVVYDLEGALVKAHPDALCPAVADFWRSWQVQQHSVPQDPCRRGD
jgi:hypothetical protein